MENGQRGRESKMRRGGMRRKRRERASEGPEVSLPSCHSRGSGCLAGEHALRVLRCHPLSSNASINAHTCCRTPAHPGAKACFTGKSAAATPF